MTDSLHYQLDCALRNERDATRRMQLGLRMGMEREGSAPNYKARQDAILRRDNRVRVRATCSAITSNQSK